MFKNFNLGVHLNFRGLCGIPEVFQKSNYATSTKIAHLYIKTVQLRTDMVILLADYQ